MIVITTIILIITLILYLSRRKNKNIDYKDKKILILGGSSGLGLSLARLFKDKGANVTIAARNPTKFQNEFLTESINICDLDSFPNRTSIYDFIFCCAGMSKPGYFKNLKPSDYENMMKLNYLGTINTLYHHYKNNKRPFSFIMISSTVSFFTFPGYSAYSPSKAALKNFYDSVFYEIKNENIDLYIYHVTSMKTPGFENENKIKPEVTKQIEGDNGLSPEYAARMLVNGMNYQNEICSDFFTRIFKVRLDVDCVTDYLYALAAILLYPVARLYVRYKNSN